MVGDVQVEEVACADLVDEAVAALAGLLSTTSVERSDGDPPISPSQLAVDERINPTWVRKRRALAWDERGELVGTALVELEDRTDNRHLAWVEVDVAPAARRTGLGGRLLTAVLPAALAEGRTLCMGGAPEGGPGAAFAASLGLEVGQREHRNRVRTADLPVDELRRWVADGELRATAYEILAVDGPLPDGLLQPYAEAAGVMNDAPIDDLALEDFTYSVSELREAHEARARRGTERWTVLAIHRESGAIAGLTELFVPAHDTWLAEQGDTGVLAPHRGSGLGRWLKAVNALRMVDERPDVAVVQTWNASTNPHMLAINHAMGFRSAGIQELVQGPIAPLLDRLGSQA
ncbi:MAG: GNAT family N-acetyltransferase [Actinomycetota bacterium]|nr:GNAT family N-acetyltransferase [Actinomycetota bacterium]